MVNDVRHILTQLQGIKSLRKNNNSIWICCPFHLEKTPSCSINLQEGKYPIGTFYCFGCTESGSWDKLAEKLGVAKLGKKTNSFVVHKERTNELKSKLLRNKKVDTVRIKKCEIPDWRGINGKLLEKLGATVYIRNKVKFIDLPIIVDNEHLADIKARFIKPKNKFIPSYVNSNASKTKEYGLFPYHYVDKLLKNKVNWKNKETKAKYICLVEGPRDALGLIQFGIPALAILGTYSWNKDKLRLLKILCVLHDVGIIVIMDSDEAGTKAQKTIVADLKKFGVEYKQVKLKRWAKEYNMDKLDPMSAPLELKKSIRSLAIP